MVFSKSKAQDIYDNDHDFILSKESEAKLRSQPCFDALVQACLRSLPEEDEGDEGEEGGEVFEDGFRHFETGRKWLREGELSLRNDGKRLDL